MAQVDSNRPQCQYFSIEVIDQVKRPETMTVVPGIPPAPESFDELAKIVSWVAFDSTLKLCYHLIIPMGMVSTNRITNANCATGHSKACTMRLLRMIHKLSPGAC